MSSDRFAFDVATKRYKDLTTGKFLSSDKVVELRNTFSQSQQNWSINFSASLADGSMTLDAFEREFRERVKRVYVAEYLLGRGGKNVMTPTDYGRIGAMVKKQYAYARGFTEAIQNAELSQAEIAARASMYFSSSRQSFERGLAAAWGAMALPGYPGEDTECRSNCHCFWDHARVGDEIHSYWRLGGSNNCDVCVVRAAEWSPWITSIVD